MLNVIPTQKALELILERFSLRRTDTERIPLDLSLGRIPAADIASGESIPAFSRSTVDGYALSARDTFGCSETLPIPLRLAGRVAMGGAAKLSIAPGECAYVPTGGALPENADAMVMIEYAEELNDGSVLIMKPSAPGAHIIYAGDDVNVGDILVHAGISLTPSRIGALAAAGKTAVEAYKPPRVGIISTGDELISIEKAPGMGQIRDVNTHTLTAAVRSAGAEPVVYGIVRDEYTALSKVTEWAIGECDVLLISGGSSVGEKDATARMITELGELIFHGVAMKPGKPTAMGEIAGKPVFGLPGHPVAAYFVFEVLVLPLLCQLTGSVPARRTVNAKLTANIPSNNGREEYVAVSLTGCAAEPIVSKSGLITSLARADGYIRIPRDAEGLGAGAAVEVNLI